MEREHGSASSDSEDEENESMIGFEPHQPQDYTEEVEMERTRWRRLAETRLRRIKRLEMELLETRKHMRFGKRQLEYKLAHEAPEHAAYILHNLRDEFRGKDDGAENLKHIEAVLDLKQMFPAMRLRPMRYETDEELRSG